MSKSIFFLPYQQSKNYTHHKPFGISNISNTPLIISVSKEENNKDKASVCDKNAIKKEIKKELKDEMKDKHSVCDKNIIKKEIIDDHAKRELKSEIKYEVKNEVTIEIKDDINVIKEDVKKVKKDVKTEIDSKCNNKEIKKELQDEINSKCNKEAIRKELQDEINSKCNKEAIRKELQDEINSKCNKEAIKKEIEDKLKKVLKKEIIKDVMKEVVKDDIIDEIKDKLDKTRDSDDDTTITAKIITPEHTTVSKCGNYAGYYKYSPANQVGRYAFNTSDVLRKLYPEIFNSDDLMEHIKAGANDPYSPHDFKFGFSDEIDYAWGSPSNMWCKKCKDIPNDPSCKNDPDIKSVCYSAKSSWDTPAYSKNFFNVECPNLISRPLEMGAAEHTITMKQIKPLLIVNYRTGKIVNREGDETDQNYSTCQSYIQEDGRPKPIKECKNDQCKDCINALNESLWDVKDRTVKLIIPELNNQATIANTTQTIYESENDNTPYYTSNNDLI